MVNFSLFNISRHVLTEPAINQYLKELSKLLCCNNKKRGKILLDFQNRLTDFYASQEDAPTYNQIVEQFGSPTDVANSFLSECSSTQLHSLAKYNSTKRILIITVCILAFLILLTFSIYKIYQYHVFQSGYMVETIYDKALDTNFSTFESGSYNEY